MNRTLTLTAGLALLVAQSSLAQEMPPPKVLQIIREQVKPGKTSAHEKVELGWPRAYAKANWPSGWIGMTSLTGAPEAWFVSGWDSYAAYEKNEQDFDKNAALKAENDQMSMQDGDLLSGWTNMLASYRPNLSYGANIQVAKMRYFAVTTYRVNPGHGPDFLAARRLEKEAHEKAKQDEHYAYYQVVSGAPAGTYLVFRPMKSMAEMDVEVHGKAYQDAVGEAGRDRLRELQKDTLLSSASQIFAFNPKISYSTKEFAAGDPDFWTPKPAPTKPAETKK